jgi:hypothetical protein
MSGWRVEKKTPRGWIFIGIIETNFAWASQWWADLGRRWQREYRLKEE